MTAIASHPILSCAETRALEEKLFSGDEAREWPAMQRAGCAIAAAVLRDFKEIGGFPDDGRVLVLAGKGHNGGDAIIAAQAILEKFPAARAEVRFAFGERTLRPLAARAWRDLAHAGRERVTTILSPQGAYDLCLDGIFGFQFRLPANARIAKLIADMNALPIRLRAAIDLPSADLFRADFTYATGCVKGEIIFSPQTGRVRYLDLGFFDRDEIPSTDSRVLTSAVLAPLAELREPNCDKRAYGHVFLVGGSRRYPGAILMSTLAALRSGAGLVTACVPESLVPAFAARAPEAMWIGWPETPEGNLALEGEHLLRSRIDRATAFVIGPGLGCEPESLALAENIAKESVVPLVLDADAIRPAIVRAGSAPRIVTPHTGENNRLRADSTHQDVASRLDMTTVLKGPRTLISNQAGMFYSFFGGPVLARGGSGDLLAGLIGGLLAQTPREPLLAAARGVVWHGLAADHLARAHGQTAVSVTQLLDFLPAALRESATCPPS